MTGVPKSFFKEVFNPFWDTRHLPFKHSWDQSPFPTRHVTARCGSASSSGGGSYSGWCCVFLFLVFVITLDNMKENIFFLRRGYKHGYLEPPEDMQVYASKDMQGMKSFKSLWCFGQALYSEIGCEKIYIEYAKIYPSNILGTRAHSLQDM